MTQNMKHSNTLWVPMDVQYIDSNVRRVSSLGCVLNVHYLEKESWTKLEIFVLNAFVKCKICWFFFSLFFFSFFLVQMFILSFFLWCGGLVESGFTDEMVN